MPLINEPVSFSTEELAQIEQKVNSADYSHRNWSDDDLQSIRSKIRNHYREQQNGVCAFCKGPISLVSAQNAHVEHISPKSQRVDFMFEPKNLCVICADCNTIKRAQEVTNTEPQTIESLNERVQYPRASNSFKIVHPHIDEYDLHIIKKGLIYIDRSQKGHFTIGCCKLNRFFHQFEIDDSFVDDAQLNQMMTDYLESNSAIQKARILTELRNSLINM